MYRYLSFDIEAIEHLKLGSFDRDANNEYTYSYIPGSVIKGAVVWNLVKKNGFVDKKILNGNTIFYNAYPIVNGISSVPMMQGYVGDKQHIRSRKEDICITHSFKERKENTIPYNNYEFIAYDEVDKNTVKGYNPGKVENLHINKKDAYSNNNKTKIFRYEAIEKGEKFRGFIRVDEEHEEAISEILKEEIIYFGGSRGSGYGKCKMSNFKYVPDVSIYRSNMDIQKDLYIYFLSDAILYYDGQLHTYIPEEKLTNMLGIDGQCKYIKSFSSLNMAASFNSLYKTNTICYTAVSKGSVIKYNIDGKIDPDRIQKLVSNGVGLRREDGYGQIAVLNKIPDNMVISKFTKAEYVGKSLELEPEHQALVNKILYNVFNSRTIYKMELLLLSLMESARRPKNFQTQIGKLNNIFQNGKYKEQDAFKLEVSLYLDHMRNKKDKKVWHELDKFVFIIESENLKKEYISLQKLLIDFVEGRQNAVFKKLNGIIEKVSIGDYCYPMCENNTEVNYSISMDFFIALFEHCLRDKEEVKS